MTIEKVLVNIADITNTSYLNEMLCERTSCCIGNDVILQKLLHRVVPACCAEPMRVTM